MSENINPDVNQQESEVLDYSGKTLSELSDLFQKFATSEDRLQNSKEAEALKAAFYKTLNKEKEKLEEGAQDVFLAVEENFKALYNTFKKEKAEWNRQQDALKEENLKAKEKVIEDLKALLEKDEDVTATFPAFREIQNRWRAIGAVPMQNFRDLNNTYQLYVEQFYDKLKINRELRDLDFKKNLEAKTSLCEKAEALLSVENAVSAFNELQKLHDAWKDLGPVAKQYRDEIWERFKEATAQINKKHQEYFVGLKAEQSANLEAKEGLCAQVEEIAAREIADSKVWNACSKEIEEIQAKWRKIGFATKKENQKIYDRFRAACDKFYESKRNFYEDFKSGMEDNVKLKEEICEKAEQLKNSTEWKKATDEFIELQKRWKEIGAVPRKKSEQLWKRFRGACDEFFAAKQQNSPEENFRSNLKAKQQVIADILAYTSKGQEEDAEALASFTAAFNAIGFVPFKEKDNVSKAFKEAVQKVFPNLNASSRPQKSSRKPESEKDKLVAKYRALEQEIATKENNILFFANGKGANPLVDKMREGIEQAKKDLKKLEEQIRKMEETQAEQE